MLVRESMKAINRVSASTVEWKVYSRRNLNVVELQRENKQNGRITSLR